eukprot:CAMPEP_0116020618 /NCGR_PEP_ID=MMETSP0321-20121206/9903_1 /TAXON_ID=163516 /ORGANISM="Leptocylindrus danicus var. danicus, Strain B650" /LENGTH=367 /DNA_ID=CAMNT_0003491341 /DNA_START=217 /DNA_END=1320 /DNA_ORIENTATION=+
MKVPTPTVPQILFGTYKLFEETEDCVKFALTSHLTHGAYKGVDCAPIYRNQKKVGAALESILNLDDDNADSTTQQIKRDELWVQTKLWRSTRVPQVMKELKKSLRELRLDYVDCYLMHWPGPGRLLNYPPVLKTSIESIKKEPSCKVCGCEYELQVEKHINSNPNVRTAPMEWKREDRLLLYDEMARMKELGLTKSLGVCNFSKRLLVELLEHCDRVGTPRPVVVQNEFHPFLVNRDVLDLCNAEGIAFQAHSSLGGPGNSTSNSSDLLSNQVIMDIAKRLGRTPAQVLFRWSIQRGCCLVPKSKSEDRIVENISLFDDWELKLEDMEKMGHLNTHVVWVGGRDDDASVLQRNCMFSWLREFDPDHY